MQHDTIIWSVIKPGGGGFCSFRRRMPNNPTKFCKNPYNVLGLCHPGACPLANSRYATVREHKGDCYLYIKTIERSHTPSKMWEKIKLSKDYMKALKQIDEHLIWWPQWMIHKCKLRLTKIHQYLIRSRKLALSLEPKMVRIWKPYERQQRNREEKAEIAARITNVIKQELLDRLNEGVYEGIYNFPSKQYNEILEEKGVADEEDQDESEIDIDLEEEEQGKKKKKTTQKSKQKLKKKEEEEDDIPEFVAYSDLSDNDEIEELGNKLRAQQQEQEPEYEYEYEYATPHREMMANSNSTKAQIGNFSSTYGKPKIKISSEQPNQNEEKEKTSNKTTSKEKVLTDENELRESLLNMMSNFDSQTLEDLSSIDEGDVDNENDDDDDNYGEYNDDDDNDDDMEDVNIEIDTNKKSFKNTKSNSVSKKKKFIPPKKQQQKIAQKQAKGKEKLGFKKTPSKKLSKK